MNGCATKRRYTPKGTPLPERLAFYTDVNGPLPERRPELGRCAVWTGAKSKDGYGQLTVNGRREYTHVLTYALAHGSVPSRTEVEHLCRTRSCRRLDHLEAVDHRENCLRGDSPPAENARKTHCVRGHDLKYAYQRKSRIGRACRECARLHQRAARMRKKAA